MLMFGIEPLANQLFQSTDLNGLCLTGFDLLQQILIKLTEDHFFVYELGIVYLEALKLVEEELVEFHHAEQNLQCGVHVAEVELVLETDDGDFGSQLHVGEGRRVEANVCRLGSFTSRRRHRAWRLRAFVEHHFRPSLIVFNNEAPDVLGYGIVVSVLLRIFHLMQARVVDWTRRIGVFVEILMVPLGPGRIQHVKLPPNVRLELHQSLYEQTFQLASFVPLRIPILSNDGYQLRLHFCRALCTVFGGRLLTQLGDSVCIRGRLLRGELRHRMVDGTTSVGPLHITCPLQRGPPNDQYLVSVGGTTSICSETLFIFDSTDISMSEDLQANIDRFEALKLSIDLGYLSLCSAFVLLMQLGFAFLEGGCLRYKDMQSIMLKVFMNTCVTVIVWFFVGYGVAFGTDEKEVVGGTQFVGIDYRHHKHLAEFAFQTAVASAATSIVSGGAAGRMTYGAYFLLSIVFSAVIYPFCAHWGFGKGWLMQLGYHDYAGSATVHASAGMGALVTTIFLRPRLGRFNEKLAAHFEPNNPTYITLACLSLWMCWCFFNGGSSLGISDGASVFMARAMMNTFIGGASGALTTFFITWLMNMGANNRFSLVMVCNGNLAGLVAITGPCDNVEAWGAFVIGILGGMMMVFANRVLYKLRIDDPVDAISIHFACGMLGSNLVSWFDYDTGILYGKGGYQFGVQMLGSFIYIAWSALCHIVALTLISFIVDLRVSKEEEMEGLDLATMGCVAYEKVEVRIPSEVVEPREQ